MKKTISKFLAISFFMASAPIAQAEIVSDKIEFIVDQVNSEESSEVYFYEAIKNPTVWLAVATVAGVGGVAFKTKGFGYLNKSSVPKIETGLKAWLKRNKPTMNKKNALIAALAATLPGMGLGWLASSTATAMVAPVCPLIYPIAGMCPAVVNATGVAAKVAAPFVVAGIVDRFRNSTVPVAATALVPFFIAPWLKK